MDALVAHMVFDPATDVHTPGRDKGREEVDVRSKTDKGYPQRPLHQAQNLPW